MKKTNFVVIFWLILAIGSFIIIYMNLRNFLEDISYLVISDRDYMSRRELLRDLITSVPMSLIFGGVFYISVKRGMKEYQK
ncbi:hypothetical protein EFE32_11075 [Lactococcus lactis subsp. lactis]|uniref:hypothetical protein n=1 Tax=Lactococcus lactis TaxID=1358 RepID=UPI00223A6D52|nr:hypothetical protein [Lactococcus lactis]MCT0017340.1 hypothetical protein [Lactococcus lactis subsp. lactis]